jgi:hypothetical protein
MNDIRKFSRVLDYFLLFGERYGFSIEGNWVSLLTKAKVRNIFEYGNQSKQVSRQLSAED